ncbi:hypothetical protein RGQ29_029494 [Quercus rubra]|uniref:Uncharacterized protein n=1 Tax=Quercus rubra TaxID=3512 RepID=A0AAN7IG45_QUERU|nr:hypothetical protein RGQ29_029494 [Quercus rubra]KAK4570660.1 hypothetical protein RGQ29_029494 [Quercus rubra]
MEDYLLCMKTLRSQMNDVEDQTAKITVEEQMQLTTIHTLEIDLNSAKSETKQLKEDTEKMMKAKGQICSQILERQRKIVSLESDSSTLAQTLELIQQEKASLSSKLLEMRTYFTKVGEEIDAKFQEQQDWVNSHKISGKLGEHVLVKDRISEQTGETEGKSSIDGDLIMDNLMKQLLEQVKFKENDFEPELRTMDIKTLEEEHNALLLDKAGVIEYLQTLPSQIETLKGISHVITCACGKEYKVGVDCCV